MVNVYGGKFTGCYCAAFAQNTGIINIYGGEFYATLKDVVVNATGNGATLKVYDTNRGNAVINVYCDENGVPFAKFYNASGENGEFQEYDYS